MLASDIEEARDTAGRLLLERRYEQALACILSAFRIEAEGRIASHSAPWAFSPKRPLPGTEASNTGQKRTPEEELACLGVDCCNRQGERSLYARDWPAVLRHSANAEKLSQAPAWRDRWRFDSTWAIGRFQAIRCAAEALRGVDGAGKNLQAARDRMLLCEEVLDAWPNHSWHPDDIQVHTYLADLHWQLRDLQGARRSCRRALAIQASRQPQEGGRAKVAEVYSSMFVLWVLNSAVFADRSWSEGEASLRCAKYLVRQLEKDALAAEADGIDRCKRLLRKMKWNERHAEPPYEKDPGLLRHNSVQQADLAWLLSIWDSHPDPTLLPAASTGSTEAAAPGAQSSATAGSSVADAASTATAGGSSPSRPAALRKGGGSTRVGSAAVSRADGSSTEEAKQGASSEIGDASPKSALTGAREQAVNGRRIVPGPSRPDGRDVVLLAIEASFPGQSLKVPVWKVDVDARYRALSVVKLWARENLGVDEVPSGLEATAGLGGRQLQLDQSLGSLRPDLPVREARFLIAVVWPQDARVGGDGPATPLGRMPGQSSAMGKLMGLNISCRYANVDGKVLGYHNSNTYLAKLEAGMYEENAGLYVQTAFVEAMRMPRTDSPGTLAHALVDESIGSCELVVFSDHSFAPNAATKASDDVQSARSGKEAFRATLRGPASLMANWEANCRRSDESSQIDKMIPCPVFIPSKGRATRSNLNWEADHVYGPLARDGKPSGRFPVVCVVVEPQDEAEYREAWPQALMLVLPKDNGGPGYARWAIQRACTRAFVWRSKSGSEVSGGKWQERSLPWIWVFDDSLSMFYKLVEIGSDLIKDSSTGKVQRTKQREAPEGAPMFREAMLEVQRHSFMPKAAVAGFLRDDGTASCKKLGWKMDEMSLWKVVLLNLHELKKLHAEYVPELQLYEDVCLNHEVMKNGGHTLKCQSYCFRAAHTRQGGCSEQTNIGKRGGSGTQLEDLVPNSAFEKLNETRRRTVRDLLGWVRSKEQLSTEKGGRAPAEEPAAGGDSKTGAERAPAKPSASGPSQGLPASAKPSAGAPAASAAPSATASSQAPAASARPAAARPQAAREAHAARPRGQDEAARQKAEAREQKRAEAKERNKEQLRRHYYEVRRFGRDHRQEYTRRKEVRAAIEDDIIQKAEKIAQPEGEPSDTHYATLGVTKTTNQVKVKRAFLTQAAKELYHAKTNRKRNLSQKLEFSPKRMRRFTELAAAYHVVLRTAPERALCPSPQQDDHEGEEESGQSDEGSSDVDLQLSDSEGDSDKSSENVPLLASAQPSSNSGPSSSSSAPPASKAEAANPSDKAAPALAATSSSQNATASRGRGAAGTHLAGGSTSREPAAGSTSRSQDTPPPRTSPRLAAAAASSSSAATTQQPTSAPPSAAPRARLTGKTATSAATAAQPEGASASAPAAPARAPATRAAAAASSAAPLSSSSAAPPSSDPEPAAPAAASAAPASAAEGAVAATGKQGERQMYITKKHLDRWGYTPGCPRCCALQGGAHIGSHSAECRFRISEALAQEEQSATKRARKEPGCADERPRAEDLQKGTSASSTSAAAAASPEVADPAGDPETDWL